MPAYPWLERLQWMQRSCRAHAGLRAVGVPYTDEQINKSVEEVQGKTELEAVIAFLQGLGLALK